jgi:predicted GNAT family acetyltransferase
VVQNPDMGRWRETVVGQRVPRVGVLGDADLEAARAVCAKAPVEAVLAASRIDAATRLGIGRTGGELWGYHRDGELVAVAWAGANLVPVVPDRDPAAIDALAAIATERGRNCSSIVGDAGVVMGLWSRIRGDWGTPRDIREDQPSLVIDHAPQVEPDPFVRAAGYDDFDDVLPACIRMFTEEVGYSPLVGGTRAYEDRVRSLIAAGRSFVRMVPTGSGQRVLFKAEVGAASVGVGQVQGVWVAPDRRGERLSEAGMAAVVEATRRSIAPVVSLYVNHYNAPALAAYDRVGFRQVGTYATVLF